MRRRKDQLILYSLVVIVILLIFWRRLNVPKDSLDQPLTSTNATLERRTRIIENAVRFLAQQNETNSKEWPEKAIWQPLCSGKNLIGHVDVRYLDGNAPTFEEIGNANPMLQPGGSFKPRDCMPLKGRIAIVIPYRDRLEHLRALLSHLHPILQRQQLDYQIFVVEQAGNDTFNKALLMNVAYYETQKLASSINDDAAFQCYIFHDVDLFIEDDRALYHCEDYPVHLSEYVDKFDYEPWSGTDILFGGVVSINRRLFKLLNGYSNLFVGWGGEDEEMRTRLALHQVKILRPNRRYYKYKMARHNRDHGNPYNMLRRDLMATTLQRMAYDGLSVLEKSQPYKVERWDSLPTHTHVLISFDTETVYRSTFGDVVLDDS